MTKSEFLVEFTDLLQTEQEITPFTPLKELEEWDSLAFMGVIAFFGQHFKIRLTFDDLEPCHTATDVMALAGEAIS